jgi:hypothetical protein
MTLMSEQAEAAAESAPALRRGLTADDRRALREQDREEARRQLGVLTRLSADRGIRRGR